MGTTYFHIFSLVLTSRKPRFKLDLLTHKHPVNPLKFPWSQLSNICFPYLPAPQSLILKGQVLKITSLLHLEIIGLMKNVLTEMSCTCGRYFFGHPIWYAFWHTACSSVQILCFAKVHTENSALSAVWWKAALFCLFWPCLVVTL